MGAQRRYANGVIDLADRRRGKVTHGLRRAEAADLLDDLAALAAELETHHCGNPERLRSLRRRYGQLIARLAAFLARVIPRPAPDPPRPPRAYNEPAPRLRTETARPAMPNAPPPVPAGRARAASVPS